MIIPRFNPSTEPARTVGFGNQAASAREISEEPGSERTRERFDCERERLACVCDHWTQRKVTVDVKKSDRKKIRRP
jgi:hypothetical protein